MAYDVGSIRWNFHGSDRDRRNKRTKIIWCWCVVMFRLMVSSLPSNLSFMLHGYIFLLLLLALCFIISVADVESLGLGVGVSGVYEVRGRCER